ncbi:NAD(P)/FAD-dependent oxidoreductase [Pelagibacterium montanilacus]|uniref:NAD(P)/FAD-dependent oxidoreductase n=1 Tax=Pelagibacterium montanilacus TaxID=2185280 RepID=UPI000F8E0616|nr:NAD(P)/FAD-dependent oxidoreductase [Pelagibacterium montanilacus]
MDHDSQRTVIVGAGFAGLKAAQVLTRAGQSITIIDRRNHHLFQPLLYQVATAALAPSDIAVPIRAAIHPRNGAEVKVLMDEIASVDKAARIVHTKGGASISYSHLILATGAKYTYFGHDEDWAPHAPALKSIDDALNIRRRVLLAFERAETASDAALRARLLTFVVVGGGPTGVETAGAIAELAKASLARDFSNIDPRSARIVLVEAMDTVLGGFPDHLRSYTLDKLGELGVDVQLEAPVSRIDEKGVVAGDVTIDTPNVFWCAGVTATPVGAWLGVDTEKNGTLAVRNDLTLEGHPEIFVVGDASTVLDEDGEPLPALAPVAKQQGAYAAKTIVARKVGKAPPGPFRYRDWGTMATIGRSSAVGKFGKLEARGAIAWLLWGFVHVGYLVGFRNRISVIVNWLWAWASYAKGARLITGPEGAHVQSLQSTAAVDAELDESVANLKESRQKS